MNKIWLRILMAVLVLSLILAGCQSRNITHQYQQALTQTEKIDKASELIEFNIELDFSHLTLDQEAKKKLEMFRSVHGTFLLKFDKEKGHSYLDGHIDMKNLGFDMKLYEDKENIVALLPMFSKYLLISKKEMAASLTQPPSLIPLNGKKTEELWQQTISQSRIEKLGGKMISTNEGEIRATAFKVNIPEPQIKELAKTFLQTVINTPEVKNTFVELFEKGNQKEAQNHQVQTSFTEFLKHLENSIDQLKIREFQHTGAFDKDFYIVEENLSFNYELEAKPPQAIIVNFSMTSKRWDIHKTQNIELPVLNPENSFTLEQLEENTPKLMEDMLKSSTE